MKLTLATRIVREFNNLVLLAFKLLFQRLLAFL